MKIKATATERKILDAIKTVSKEGVAVKEGGWYIQWDSIQSKFVTTESCACPLGALLLATQPKPSDDQLEALADSLDDAEILGDLAAKALGKPVDWVNNFIVAFDEGIDDDGDPGASSGLKLHNIYVEKAELDA